MTPRGLRNRNPLNIRKTRVRWKGLATKQKDKSFCQFKSNVFGYRAAIKILRTYNLKYGLNTISKIINRWAPDNENNTNAYVKVVVSRSGIDSNTVIDLDDIRTVVAIVEAMSYVENGVPGNVSEIVSAVEMIK